MNIKLNEPCIITGYGITTNQIIRHYLFEDKCIRMKDNNNGKPIWSVATATTTNIYTYTIGIDKFITYMGVYNLYVSYIYPYGQ